MLETAHTPATAARPSAHTGTAYPKIDTEFSSHENALVQSEDEGTEPPATTPVAGPLDTAPPDPPELPAPPVDGGVTGGAVEVDGGLDGGVTGGVAAGVDAAGVAELFTTLAGSVEMN